MILVMIMIWMLLTMITMITNFSFSAGPGHGLDGGCHARYRAEGGVSDSSVLSWVSSVVAGGAVRPSPPPSSTHSLASRTRRHEHPAPAGIIVIAVQCKKKKNGKLTLRITLYSVLKLDN